MVSKKVKAINATTNSDELYSLKDAVSIMQTKWQRAKFVESVDVAVNLGIDIKKSDQNVRGSTVLPHGNGKVPRVAVFIEDANLAEEAKKSGADIVKGLELLDDIKKGELDFDVLVTAPNMMSKLARVGQKLGPKGLMPNPKSGTVTNNISEAVSQIKKGQISFRADKGGVVHCSVGRMDFADTQIIENIQSLIAELINLKPAVAKGIYIKNISISSTMGGGIAVNTAII